MLLIVSTSVPLSVSVTVCAELLVPTAWLAKVRFFVLREAIACPVPMPARGRIWGESAALSVIVIEPVRVQIATGAKVAEIVQLAPAARDAPQLLVCPNSVPAVILVMVSGVAPEFSRITFLAALVVPTACLANMTFAGVSFTTGTAPVPLMVSFCGLPVALSLTAMVALRITAYAGANVTVKVQLLPAGTVVPQLLVWAYSLALPVKEIFVIVIPVAPLLVKVAVCGALVVPIVCDPKDSEDGEIVTV